MITLLDFKQKVLHPLLHGEPVTADVPVTLFAARTESPLDYICESERWDEISGASKKVIRAGEKMRAVLAADGYTIDDLLHGSLTEIFAVCHDEKLAQHWQALIGRAVAAETDLLTVSTAIRTLSLNEITSGLYGIPRSVVGVPGVNDYQERINRYYGLNSPSTVPRNDAVANRRRFGEVVALMHTLLESAREARQIVPFYEMIPFAVRCASCYQRPAETLDAEQQPICGVCLHKRKEPQSIKIERIGIIRIETLGLSRLMEQQRSPAAYRRLVHDLHQTLTKAVADQRIPVVTLAAGVGWLVLATSAADALETVTSILEDVSLHYGLKLPAAVVGAVALASTTQQYRAVNDLATQTLDHLRRAVEGVDCAIDVRMSQTQQVFDRFRKPFTLDEARQLLRGAKLLREAKLPADIFPEMSEQVARGSAGLYYTFERAKLTPQHQQVFQRLERDWDAGSVPGPHFFSMLSTALALATLAP